MNWCWVQVVRLLLLPEERRARRGWRKSGDCQDSYSEEKSIRRRGAKGCKGELFEYLVVQVLLSTLGDAGVSVVLTRGN